MRGKEMKPKVVEFVASGRGKAQKSEAYDRAIHVVGSDTVVMTTDFKCPDCGSTEFEMRNYSVMWHKGDIHCASCGKFIRLFDAR